MYERNPYLDTLRGLAIIIMVIDHAAAIIFHQEIEFPGVRFFTRIAEPLFALLFGYFLFGRTGQSVQKRLIEVGLAAVGVNLFFFPYTGEFEVLASFACAMAIYLVIGDGMIYLLPLLLLHSMDFTVGLLNYPLTILLPQVSLGMLIRKGSVIIPALFFLFGTVLIPPSLGWTCLFTIPAALILAAVAGNRFRFSAPFLQAVGKRPIESYLLQFVLIIAVAFVAGLL